MDKHNYVLFLDKLLLILFSDEVWWIIIKKNYSIVVVVFHLKKYTNMAMNKNK